MSFISKIFRSKNKDNGHATSPQDHDSPRTPALSAQKEDPYHFLRSFDTLILIDDSGSMAGQSWRETSKALRQLLPTIIARDADGIDIFFLNHKSSDPGSPKNGIPAGGYRNVTRVAEVERIFKAVKPSGLTPTGDRLDSILGPYLAHLESEAKKGRMDDVKPLNILAITDGIPSDDVESVIVSTATRLDRLDAVSHQVGVQFFQVGNDQRAAGALKHLDDELEKLGIRDIVDTCTWMGDGGLTAEGILKACLGAVNKRLDRRELS